MLLTPKSKDAAFVRAKVWIEPTSGSLLQFEAVEQNGLTRLVRITNFSPNAAVNAKSIHLHGPEGREGCGYEIAETGDGRLGWTEGPRLTSAGPRYFQPFRSFPDSRLLSLFSTHRKPIVDSFRRRCARREPNGFLDDFVIGDGHLRFRVEAEDELRDLARGAGSRRAAAPPSKVPRSNRNPRPRIACQARPASAASPRNREERTAPRALSSIATSTIASRNWITRLPSASSSLVAGRQRRVARFDVGNDATPAGHATPMLRAKAVDEDLFVRNRLVTRPLDRNGLMA